VKNRPIKEEEEVQSERNLTISIVGELKTNEIQRRPGVGPYNQPREIFDP
jgi:hypothetical protein